MNPVLSGILETGCTHSTDGELIRVHSHISPRQGEFLQQLIRELRPEGTLEIGLAYGISALFICEALFESGPSRHHIIVDPAQFDDKYWKGCGINNLRSAGYGEMIEFYNLPSHLALPKLESDGRQIDFAFIDGSHLFDYALADFFLTDKLLRVGGVMAFDDLWMPGIQRLCRFILANRSYSVFRSFPENTDRKKALPLKRKLLKALAGSSKAIRKIMRYEYAHPETDFSLGSQVQCLVLRKEDEDRRSWDFHHDF